MSFEGQYLSYTEYQSLGGTLARTPFNIAEFYSRKEIDLRTQNRLNGVEEIPDEVKLCDFNLINLLSKYQSLNNNRNISSETVGDYSVTYIDDYKKIISNKENEITDIIITNLYGVIVNDEHLIYLGVE